MYYVYICGYNTRTCTHTHTHIACMNVLSFEVACLNISDENVSSDEEIGPKVSEQAKADPEPLTRDDSWRSQTLSTRDWDKGKQCMKSYL